MGHSLIIGYGEVGQALEEVLGARHRVSVYDLVSHPGSDPVLPVDVLHICFPWSPEFQPQVIGYQERYRPSFTVVHSTVPVGTCYAVDAHHSPVRGSHPRLAEAMRTFTTYLAPGSDDLRAYFQEAGMKVELVARSQDTEAGKLWELAGFALNILLEKEIHEYCEAKGLDFDVVYKDFAETYNQGYAKMGVENVRRPVLKHMPGPIGGHCVVPGVALLGDELVARLIASENARWAGEREQVTVLARSTWRGGIGVHRA